ncbi:hypothetical protein [Methylobacterium oryzae]|uniref:hypothetical protein n=1 Tax=Methylobacterium oryzae TaxID=334852 RepID=UPI001F1EDA09|nr:hypothetical protein [Methylobacterium oryzae]UIN33974.1 hypothetical protein LXM90_23290 [Methylobacterium oryzae]
MKIAHTIAIILAVTIGLLLISGMLFGNHKLPEFIASKDHTYRDICIALWIFLLPNWFTLEEYWAPEPGPQLDQFRKAQQFARVFWTILSGAVAIIIGLTPATLTAEPKAERTSQVGAPLKSAPDPALR